MNKPTLHIIGLESLENRYTKEWQWWLPAAFSENFNVVDDYYGDMLDSELDPTNFLNWVSTQYFKSSQVMKFARAIKEGKVKSGDIVLFTDFWNPCVVQLKYMLDTMKINVKIAGIAHAGLYDPQDQLAKLIGGLYWAETAEYSIGECYDKIYFATEFHKEMFCNIYPEFLRKSVVAGFSMEYITNRIEDSKKYKKDKILFCQRNAPEKQPHLFVELQDSFRNFGMCESWEWVDISKAKCTKQQYHQHLRESRVCVSFALQETLGITPMEALSFGCDVLVPDRLSYKEMYDENFKYKDTDNDVLAISRPLCSIVSKSPRYELIELQYNSLMEKFFSCDAMQKDLLEIHYA